MPTQEQIKEFYDYINSQRGTPRSANVRYAKKAQYALANAYQREMDIVDGNLVFGGWIPRPGKEEEIELANKLIELGGQSVVFGKGRMYLQ